MIIGISGKKDHGKDTVGEILQYLTTDEKNTSYSDSLDSYLVNLEVRGAVSSTFKKVMWADKLKQIVCLILGCTMQQLENREFKEKELGDEWSINNPIWMHPEEFARQIEVFGADSVKGFKRVEDPKFGTTYKLDRIRKMTPRLMLQIIGTEAGRKLIHPNIWVNATMREYVTTDKIISSGHPITSGYIVARRGHAVRQYGKECKFIVPESKRVPKEYWGTELNTHWFEWQQILKDESELEFPNWVITDTRFPNEAAAIKAKKGYVVRVVDPRKPSTDTHESETALDDYKFDVVFDNSRDLEYLKNQIEVWAKSIGILDQ